jgi:hypothetical protein
MITELDRSVKFVVKAPYSSVTEEPENEVYDVQAGNNL